MSYLAEISYLATLRYKSFVFKEIFKILENSFFPLLTIVALLAQHPALFFEVPFDPPCVGGAFNWPLNGCLERDERPTTVDGPIREFVVLPWPFWPLSYIIRFLT